MTEKVIDYDSLAQEALRGVVRAVLARVLRDGIPGDHHFYIAFDTRAPGVVLSKRLREQYPEEMTIVLQHRFWDLKVEDDRFEVKLTFDSIPELLGIPYAAIKVFFDPSVPYGLQFEPSGAAAGTGRHTHAPAIVEFVGGGEEEHGMGETVPVGDAADGVPGEGAREPATASHVADEAHADDDAEHDDDESEKSGKSAEIVELDAFRKKQS